MRKHLKSIAAALMVVAMLVTSSLPAMAAEYVSSDETAISASESSDSVERVQMPVAEFHYTGRLRTGEVLGTITIPRDCKTVTWTIGRTGESGVVNIRIVEGSRLITATANGQLSSLTWNSRLPAGTYTIKVSMITTDTAHHDCNLYFYD